ncbi:5'-3' exoribonuclease 2 [Cryomyces minteri]|uniref:5'-3' exoribonuclease n=1 Tax=Cryomyces minteri TaxID=331657 RepID=A0A4U0XS03_9PEZI|nr:5'-3' exoribonuclease 2 [Cryomyces minteri]
MGVPALFRWLSQKYPKIISPVIEEQPREIEGEEVPIDTRGPNPNGEEFDNLYLDMNGIVHPCSHPEEGPPPATEEEMMLAVFEYTERVVKMVRPRKLMMIAVDGVAPRAKMNQQRSRRFRSAQEAKQKDDDKEEHLKLLKAQGKLSEEMDKSGAIKKTWDSNAITPGTPFMEILAMSLRYWIAYKLNTDPAWEKLKVIISDATVPGEGEHKIMEFIRSQRNSPEHNPNTRHVIYGLDADLIMLGLGTHEPHFRVLREDVFFQDSKPRTCHLCGQVGHMAAECRGEAKVKQGQFDEKQNAAPLKPFIWLHVSILREYLAIELDVPSLPFRFDLERALDDWVFMCFFVGNDFLPHLPSLDIREQGIDTLIAIWRDNLPVMGGYVTKDGHVDLARAQFILEGLAKQEDAIFKRRKQVDDKREAGAKRRKLETERRNNRNSGAGNGYNDPSTPVSYPGSRRRGEPIPDINALPTFAPGQAQTAADPRYTSITHESVVNRGAVTNANVANRSAAAVLKEKLLAGKAAKAAETQIHEATNNGGVEALPASGSSTAEAAKTPPSALGKRKAELMEEDNSGTPGRNTPDSAASPATPKTDPDEPAPDNIRLWEDGYADRYYEQKFKADPKDIGFRHKVAHAYVEGLAWVLLYYFQGCPSWTWYYPYHYAPFAADFVDLDKMAISFDKGKPFRPYEQLMGVMPAASRHTIPDVFHPLMTDEDSDIIDFYPEDFPLDLNGKKFAWQGVALLPFIDAERLLAAMDTKYPLLTHEQVARNERGKDVLLFSTRHPLYEEVAMNFYSKKQGAPKYKLNVRVSEGLAGKVEKNDTYLPQSSLSFPLSKGVMPDLDEDYSISVHYEMPKSTHVHKSMLLRGVKFGTLALDHADIEATRGRSRQSGRHFGGVPLNDNYTNGGRGRGRGGRINYGADSRQNYNDSRNGYSGDSRSGHVQQDGRPNPFAAHLNPQFVPPPQFAVQNGYGAPPPGWVPPPPHLARGPPPPPPGQYGYPPQGYGGQYQGNGNGGGYGGQQHGQSGGRRGGGYDRC